MVLPGDRRAHARRPCLIKCAFLFDERVHQGRILNCSDAGVFVATTTRVHEGDTILLRLRRPDDNETVEVRAMVAHVVLRGVGQPGFGAQLFELLSTLPVARGEPDHFPEQTREVLISRALRASRADDSLDDSLDDSADDGAGDGDAPAGAPPIPPLEPGQRLQIRARESRHVHKVSVRFALTAGARALKDASIVNVSRSGLYLATDPPPAPNALLTIWFDGADIDGAEEELQVLAQVVWSSAERPSSGLAPGVGCRVLGFNPEGHRRRWQRMLRDLLVIGNPLFRSS